MKNLIQNFFKHTSASWKAFYKSKYDEWHVSVPTDGSMNLALFNNGIPKIGPVDNREAYAKLIASAPIGLKVAIKAYIAILQTPAGSETWRIENQNLYCDLRNYIAQALGCNHKDVQEFFEDVALEIKYSGKTFEDALNIAQKIITNSTDLLDALMFDDCFPITSKKSEEYAIEMALKLGWQKNMPLENFAQEVRRNVIKNTIA